MKYKFVYGIHTKNRLVPFVIMGALLRFPLNTFEHHGGLLTLPLKLLKHHSNMAILGPQSGPHYVERRTSLRLRMKKNAVRKERFFIC